jgi:hypothetical protein
MTRRTTRISSAFTRALRDDRPLEPRATHIDGKRCTARGLAFLDEDFIVDDRRATRARCFLSTVNNFHELFSPGASLCSRDQIA